MDRKKPYRTLLTLVTMGMNYVVASDEPPDIKVPHPSEVPPEYFKVSSSVTLPCAATGVPKPLYKWMKDGEDINSNVRYIRELKEGYIEIQSLTSVDEGDYQCVATNKWGSALSQVFRLRMATLGNFQECRTVKQYERRVWQYLNITRGNISSTPPPMYTWWVASGPAGHNVHKVRRSQRVIQDLEGNLYFTSVLPTDTLPDQQVYRLEAVNVVSSERSTGCGTVVKIKPGTIPEGRPLLISKSDDFVHVLEGELMKIQCIFIGSQNIEVTWSGPTIVYTREETGTVLAVSSMTSSAEGKYTCNGTNVYGLSSHSITVVMQEPPKFEDGGRPMRQIMSETETATFTCQTKPNKRSPVTTEWMINGQPFVNLGEIRRDNLKVKQIENGKQLIVGDIKRDEDMMVVQCKVSNVHGTLYVNAPLVVAVPAKPGLLEGLEWTIGLIVSLIIAAGAIVYCIARRSRRRMAWTVSQDIVDPKTEYELPNPLQLQASSEIDEINKLSPAPDLYVNCPQGPYELIDPKDIQNPDPPIQEEAKEDGDSGYINQSVFEPKRHKMATAATTSTLKRKEDSPKAKYTPDHYLLMEGKVIPHVPKVKQYSPNLMPWKHQPLKIISEGESV